jgi:hypothetical protein
MRSNVVEEPGAEALRELWIAALRAEEGDAALLAAWMEASIIDEGEAPDETQARWRRAAA